MNKAFYKPQKSFNEYLKEIEDLLRKNRGSATHIGQTIDRSMLLPGKVVNPLGLGSQQYNDQIKYEPYSPQSIKFEAPNLGGTAPSPEYQDIIQSQEPVSAQEFFRQVGRSLYAPIPVERNVDELEKIYQQTGQKYAIATLDTGEILYNDGSVGPSSVNAQPIASLSDGNVLWSDGWVRPQMPEYMMRGGANALAFGLFGQERPITQPYGVYNPRIEPTGYNIGTDFRTVDLSDKTIRNYFATPLEVVEVYNRAKPNSGYLGSRENRGYGNSVLLRLPNGSMIRVSHLNSVGQFRPGDVINPGELIGEAGATGNITGQHTDVEVYSPEGRIMSPKQFLAQVSSKSENKPLYKYESPIKSHIQEARDYAEQLVKPQNAGQKIADVIDTVKPTGNYGIGATELMRGDVEGAKQELGRTVGEIGKKAGLGEYGISEGVFTPEAKRARTQATAQEIQQQGYNPYRHLAGNIVESVGDIAQELLPGIIKEGGISERIAGGPTAHTGKVYAQELENQAQASLKPTTIQEDVQNIKQDLAQRNPFKKLGEIAFQEGNKVKNVIKTGTDQLINKAKDFAGNIQIPGIIQKPSPMDLNPEAKQVGQVSGDQMNIQTLPQKDADIRDPFFKYGGEKDFAKYLKPNAEQLYGGALNLDVFKPEFYRNPKAIGAVFGQTSMAPQATERYKQYIESKIKPGYDQPYREETVEEDGKIYRIKTPIKEYWENKYWQDILNKIPEKLTSDFSYQANELPPVKEKAFKGEVQTLPTDAPIMKSGMVNIFREAGNRLGKMVQPIGEKISDIYKPHPFSKTFSLPEKIKSVVENIPTPKIDIPQQTKEYVGEVPRAQGPQQNYTPSNANYTSTSGNASYAPAPQPRPRPRPRSFSRGPRQNYTPSNANYTSIRGYASYSPAPKPQPKPQSNPFRRIFNFVRRWF